MSFIEQLLLYVATILAGVELIYVMIFLWRIPFYKPVTADMAIYQPISVIVAAHKELNNLKELLPLLYKQKYPEYEIVIANDRPDDETELFLQGEQKKEPRLRVVRIDSVPEHVSYKKYALTLAIRAAKYEHLLFTDADCRPASDQWIALMAQAFFNESKQIVLGISPYQKQKGILNWLIRYETFLTAIQYISYALAKIPYMGVGRNLAYTKTLFLQNKGFHAHLKIIGGDDDLFVNANANAYNTNVCIEPQAYVFSIPKDSWQDWYRQKKRHLSVGKFYKKKHKFLLGLQIATHVLFWISFAFLFVNKYFFQPYAWNVFTVFLFVRILAWSATMYVNTCKMRLSCSYFSWLLYDVIYVFYVIIVGIRSYFSKPERWI